MAAIGTLIFCTSCGDLLPSTKGTQRSLLKCEYCGAENQDTGAKKTVTQSKPSDFPSLLRQKLQSSVQAVERHNIQTDTLVRETCQKCGREEVRYTNLQLRSADEGTTLFYMCDCGHSWQQDN